MEEKAIQNKVELLDLPNELLGNILVYLVKTEDVRVTRLTCPRLCDLMEDVIGIKATLELDQPEEGGKREFHSSVGIHTAVFRNASSNDFSLRRPGLLKRVTFEGSTCAPFMLKVLKECENLKSCLMYAKMGETIEELSALPLPFLYNLDLRMNPQTTRQVVEPEQLNDDSIVILGLDNQNPGGAENVENEADVRERTSITTSNTLTLLNAMDCPQLKIFCTEMWICGQPHVMGVFSTLLSFLTRMSKIDKLFISIRWVSGVDWEGRFTAEEEDGDAYLSPEDMKRAMAALGRRMKLSSFLISFNVPEDPWTGFLEEQKGLKKLGICDDLGLNGWGPLEQGLRNNAAHLRTVYIMSSFYPEERLDFSCFAGCSNLKELLLINLNANFYAGGVRAANMRDQFDNFDLLASCPNLEFVATSNITIAKDHLMQLLELNKLSHLALLNASGHGPMGDNTNGVDLELLLRLLEKRSLEGLLIDGIVAEREEDLLEIELIVRQLSCPEDYRECVLNIVHERKEKNDYDDESEEERRKKPRWWRGSSGFVFDIDFYSE